MKAKSVFGVLGLLLIGIVATGGIAAAFGFGNQAARDAVEAGDFNAWKEARMVEITEENFALLQQRHQDMEQRREEMEQQREEMYQAMEDGYDAWLDYVEGTPQGDRLLEVVTEDNFDRFVAMHDAMETGDFDSAREIAAELGLERFGPMDRGHGIHGCPGLV